MTADEIKTLKQNKWILMKSRSHPLITTMKRYNEWGIKLDCPYSMPENSARRVKYANKNDLVKTVTEKYQSYKETDDLYIDTLNEPVRSCTRQILLDDDSI